MRRVLFLAWAPFFSGAERALLLTVQHLDPARYVPHVIVGTEGETLEAFRAAGVSCERLPLEHLDRRHLFRWAWSVTAVARAARRVRPAVIHANDAPSFQPGGYAARLLGIPAVTHVRFPAGAAGDPWFLRSGFVRALFVSEYLRQDGIDEAPDLFRGKSDVLHDGVLLPAPVGETGRAQLRSELGLRPDEVVVALTGQVAEVKGIWDFVDAARLLIARDSSARFVVLGDDLKGHGAVRRAMEDKVRALGIDGSFTFLGFRPDAPRLVPAFDIVAVPSHVEPLGNATLEAMSAGRPVVGSRTGGIPEMVVDGETGLLAPPREPSALADAIGRLVASPALRSAFGAAARHRAEQHFSLERHVTRLQAIYDRLVHGERGGVRES